MQPKKCRKPRETRKYPQHTLRSMITVKGKTIPALFSRSLISVSTLFDISSAALHHGVSLMSLLLNAYIHHTGVVRALLFILFCVKSVITLVGRFALRSAQREREIVEKEYVPTINHV
jgi:hypothetical protein